MGSIDAGDGQSLGSIGVKSCICPRYPEQIFSRKETPTGDTPEFKIADCPGASCIEATLFTAPIRNDGAAAGM